jgi:hypothetical protein
MTTYLIRLKTASDAPPALTDTADSRGAATSPGEPKTR